MNFVEILKIAAPFIFELIRSKAVPALKRIAYETLDYKVDEVIKDLAQNAEKIKDAEGVKKEAYIEGTKLGIETLRAIAEKLNKAANEIEKAL